jgi:hypothetical protein
MVELSIEIGIFRLEKYLIVFGGNLIDEYVK